MRKLKLFFSCPECGKEFTIHGYWNWVLHAPFHWFGKRSTKCPECGKRSWVRWKMITKF